MKIRNFECVFSRHAALYPSSLAWLGGYNTSIRSVRQTIAARDSPSKQGEEPMRQLPQALPDVLKQRIYEVVQQIPAGMVATYGDVATIVGGGVDARTVGY